MYYYLLRMIEIIFIKKVTIVEKNIYNTYLGF